jgi:hypothetical protein
MGSSNVNNCYTTTTRGCVFVMPSLLLPTLTLPFKWILKAKQLHKGDLDRLNILPYENRNGLQR